MNTDSNTILCIGIGNSFRRDDGVGILIARSLDRLSLKNVKIVEASGEGAQLLMLWKGFNHVFLFDAVMKRYDAGKIYRFEAKSERMPSDFFKYSSHAFSLAEAVELAKVLNCLPDTLIVYGVEGREFGFGDKPSPEVIAASEKVIEKVVNEIGEIEHA